MDEYEWKRMHPMLWAMFAAASKSNGSSSERAATHADDLCAEFSKRFPVEKRPDDA